MAVEEDFIIRDFIRSYWRVNEVRPSMFLNVNLVWSFSFLFLYFLYFLGLTLILFFLQTRIVLSVLLRFTDSDCPFGIFKLFLRCVDPS
jgi:hypothetical protein